MFSTHLNWQLTWRWKSFLAQQYAASIAVIVSGAENVEWALDEGCRAYPMMVDIPYMIQVPGTPPRSPCVLHVSFTPYTSIAYFAQDDWLWHAPVILSPPMSGGACEMGRWTRSHNAPISALYRQSPDSVRRNQAIVDTSLWPRGARSDVGSSVFRSILHPRISRAKVLSGRAGYWEQAEEMRMMIQFFNDSWKGWPEPEPENKLRVYPRHSRHQQSKTTHLWQYWSTHIVRCYQVSMSLLILNAWCNEMCTKFSILLQVLFLSVWTAATLSLMRFSRIWLNFLTAMDRVRGQWCVRQQWAGMLAEELL